MKKLTYHDYLSYHGISGAHPGGFALTQEILEQESLHPQLRILEVGCGTGQTAAYLAEKHHCQVTALDQHKLMLEKAKQRFIREKVDVQLVEGSVTNMPFHDQSFDLALAESVLIFTPLEQSLSELSRVLKQGGVLLLIEMTAEQSIRSDELLDFKRFYGINQIPSEEEWSHLLRKHHFPSVQILKGESVAASLSKPTLQEPSTKDWLPSEQLDPRLGEIGFTHQDLTIKYAEHVGYRVFRAQKE